MSYWLMKSEPDEFGIDDLARRPQQREPWTGVRNYQARNFLRAMRKGDQALFYHSSCPIPGVAGVVEITREAFPDPTQFDPSSDYYDPASRRNDPRWYCVEVKLERKLTRVITLGEIKAQAKRLQGLALLRPGNRLSVLPVEQSHWDFILRLE
ncbi:MAG TPA: EVE domain-containing protein [Nevskiales bacterium]|nr:EVE domain-containing protein [Nevskiales bacterium]